jgi:hypothetical protein
MKKRLSSREFFQGLKEFLNLPDASYTKIVVVIEHDKPAIIETKFLMGNERPYIATRRYGVTELPNTEDIASDVNIVDIMLKESFAEKK